MMIMAVHLPPAAVGGSPGPWAMAERGSIAGVRRHSRLAAGACPGSCRRVSSGCRRRLLAATA